MDITQDSERAKLPHYHATELTVQARIPHLRSGSQTQNEDRMNPSFANVDFVGYMRLWFFRQ